MWRRIILVGVGAALLTALVAGSAGAAEFAVGNCQSDPVNYNTQAFAEFATRGMRIRRACNPEGREPRGLIIGNVVRGGRVKRGSVALLSMTAPEGTRFTSFHWMGYPQRADCRYALQMWADAPDVPPIPMVNVRANEKCPKPRRAQAAHITNDYDVSRATRIVQRVICLGGGGRESCSAAGKNFIRTFKAEWASTTSSRRRPRFEPTRRSRAASGWVGTSRSTTTRATTSACSAPTRWSPDGGAAPTSARVRCSRAIHGPSRTACRVRTGPVR